MMGYFFDRCNRALDLKRRALEEFTHATLSIGRRDAIHMRSYNEGNSRTCQVSSEHKTQSWSTEVHLALTHPLFIYIPHCEYDM